MKRYTRILLSLATLGSLRMCEGLPPITYRDAYGNMISTVGGITIDRAK